MELKLSHEDGYVLAEVIGPVDDSSEQLFREYLHPLVGQHGTKVVMNLAGANMITSKGIGQLVTLVANANTNGSRVILASCTPFVTIVLERCKLTKYFDMADSVSAAVSALLG
jgi:anti-anti-sigma factor